MPNVRPLDPAELAPCVVFVGADPADVRLARNVFEEDAGADLRVVPDTRHALGLLRSHLPALIVTDLDWNGGAAEIVATVRADARLRHVPIVVLTPREEDAVEVYGSGANCVMVRPESLDGFFDAMRAIQRFWLEAVVLPRG
jgi:DNA-binding response OmpR family regulator